jgi:hypothetical protein
MREDDKRHHFRNIHEVVAMHVQFLGIVVVSTLFAGCAAESEPPAAAPEPEATASLPAMIVAERGGFVPEGVEYDTTNGRLLAGSLSEGSIFHVNNDGTLTALVSDPELISSVGFEADEQRDRLLVANADRSSFASGSAGQAKLGVYNLTTGERIAMVDLGAVANDPDGTFFANDVAVGDDGTAYVTDTRLKAIYRVNMDYTASVLHRFDAAEGPSPNGIVHHPSGYLLIAAGGTLLKMPLDSPENTSPVTLPEEVPGQDGMIWVADDRLAIVSNSGNRVVVLTSRDAWATAEVAGVATYETQATTAALVGDHIYVVHPHLNDEDPPSFERVTF